MLLRVFPSAAAALVTLGLVVPAFVAFEPAGAVEVVGPVLLTLAGAGALLLFAAVALAIRTALVTIKLERAWLRSATAFDFDPPAGIPAYAIDSPAPIVALVGVFSPKLLAARAVIDACSQQELANIVAHEHGHFRSMDNFKRWLMTCAPDALRWSPLHREMTAAWGDAAEDAADDAATAGEALARVDLAALLLKVARLAQGSTWSTVAVSPFVDADGLDRRVRRLLEHEPAPTIAAVDKRAAACRHLPRRGRARRPQQPRHIEARARSRRVGRHLGTLAPHRQPALARAEIAPSFGAATVSTLEAPLARWAPKAPTPWHPGFPTKTGSNTTRPVLS